MVGGISGGRGMDRLAVRVFGPPAGLAAGGVLAGVAAKVADESGPTWLGDLGTYLTLWVFATALIGRLAPSRSQAALRAALFFTSLCIGYYAWTGYVLDYPVGVYAAAWLGVAVTAVPACAALVRHCFPRDGAVPGVLLGAVAALEVGDGAVVQLWWWATGQLPEEFPVRPVRAVAGILAALTIALLFPRRRRTRAWALLSLVPLSWAAAWVTGYLFAAVSG